MADPVVVVAMREWKRGLLAREAGQGQEMAARWLGVERALGGEISALAAEFYQEKEAGGVVSRARLYRMERYKRLLAQTKVEVEMYADWSAGVVGRGQEELAWLGLGHGAEAIRLSYPGGVGVYFDRLPIEAVENMVGLAGNGRPVGELLRNRMIPGKGPEANAIWGRLVGSLVDGTALGRNPRDVARRMADDLVGGLQKALVIARSEPMRVYREASRQQYAASGVVLGQKRLTAHDARVCAACIADEGTVYPLGEPLTDHPQGRCTPVPVVQGMPEVEWLAGEAWFRQQPPETQVSILGEGRLAAWENGEFGFSDLVTRTRDATWGGGLTPTPLSELVS